MVVRVGPWRRQSTKELMPLNLVLEKTLESPLDCKKIKSVNPKGNQSSLFIRKTDAEAEAPILWPPDAKNWLTGKNPDAGRLKAGGEGGNRGWDGWIASQTQWTWVWANSRRQRRTGKPGVLQFMGPQRVGHDWVTELIPCLTYPAPVDVTSWPD